MTLLQIAGMLVEWADTITGPNTGQKGTRVFIGPTDPISDLPVTIDFAHHQIHESEAHQVTYPLIAVSSGANLDFRIVVPANIYPHFQVEFDCLAQTTFSLYESPTISGGNLQTAYNRNRNGFIVPATLIYYAPTVTATGTSLLTQDTIGDGTAGGRGNAVEEWLLKAGTSYLARFTANAASNSVCVRFKWYEDLGV